MLKSSNEKAIDMGMCDSCYPSFVLFTMDEFERHYYLYYYNGLNPSLRIYMKFKSISSDPVQGKYFLHNFLCQDYVRQRINAAVMTYLTY